MILLCPAKIRISGENYKFKLLKSELFIQQEAHCLVASFYKQENRSTFKT